MKKRVEYILTSEEISCVEDIRMAKQELDKMINKIFTEARKIGVMLIL